MFTEIYTGGVYFIITQYRTFAILTRGLPVWFSDLLPKKEGKIVMSILKKTVKKNSLEITLTVNSYRRNTVQ